MARVTFALAAVCLATATFVAADNHAMPQGTAFKVRCPEGAEIPCDGVDVHLVGGACVPKLKRYTHTQAQELVAIALKSQLNGINLQFAKFERKIAKNQQELIKQSTEAAEKHIQGVKKQLGDHTFNIAKLDGDVKKAAGVVDAKMTKLSTEVNSIIMLNTPFAKLHGDCLKANTPGYDTKTKKCAVVDRTGYSCLDIYNKNLKTKTELFLKDGIHTITIFKKQVKVYCDFHQRFDEGTPGWTLVAKISRYSRWHMKSTAAGTLTTDGPNQYKPWKLSNVDINAIKNANKGKVGAKTMAFKFHCTRNRRESESQGIAYNGYQYFHRDCPFNGNRYIHSGDYNGKSYRTYCHDYALQESETRTYSGHADSNDCGLGGHAGGGTLASYGWHYCSGNGKRVDTQGERTNPSSSTGCGHNDSFRHGVQQSGDGALWIR